MNAFRILFLVILSLVGVTANAQSQQQYIEQAARAQRIYNANAKHAQRHYDAEAQYSQRIADEQAWQDSRPYYPPVYYAPAPQVVYVERQPVYVEPQGYVRLSRYGAEAGFQVNGVSVEVIQGVRNYRR